MSGPQLKDLASASVFEKLCYDILAAEGCRNVRGLGTGPDQGSDIMIDVPNESPLGSNLVPFIVQCKWTSSTLGQDVISDTISYLSLHRAKGLLVICASAFSGTAVTKANAISQDPASPYIVRLWDGSELYRKLAKYPWLISKYWYREDDGYSGKPDVDIFPQYSKRAMLDVLAIKPIYCSVDSSWYESVPTYNPQVRSIVAHFMQVYSTKPPVLLLIRGAIGSGKTCLAHLLLRAAGDDAEACLTDYDFKKFYYSYILAGDERFPQLLAALADLDFLIIDDFGYQLSNDVDMLSPAQILIRLVRGRVQEHRPTIIIMAREHDVPSVIGDFLNQMCIEYPVIDLGPRSWRNPESWKHPNETPAAQVPTGFLSFGWVCEKLDNIENWARSGAARLAMSDEEVDAWNRELVSRGHRQITRDDLIREMLESVIEESRRCRGHIKGHLRR